MQKAPPTPPPLPLHHNTNMTHPPTHVHTSTQSTNHMHIENAYSVARSLGNLPGCGILLFVRC